MILTKYEIKIEKPAWKGGWFIIPFHLDSAFIVFSDDQLRSKKKAFDFVHFKTVVTILLFGSNGI